MPRQAPITLVWNLGDAWLGIYDYLGMIRTKWSGRDKSFSMQCCMMRAIYEGVVGGLGEKQYCFMTKHQQIVEEGGRLTYLKTGLGLWILSRALKEKGEKLILQWITMKILSYIKYFAWGKYKIVTPCTSCTII